MFKEDAVESKPLVDATLDGLLTWAPTQGREGADLRTAVGWTKANALSLLQYDLIVEPLIRCFDIAYTSGITIYQLETIRRTTMELPAESVGAIMTKDALLEINMATMGNIISGMTFTSRQDVADLKAAVNKVFDDLEVRIADQMDSMTWRAVLKLDAAIIMHLTETARPLPRMLGYRFNLAMPSVVLAHRLYADAGRADELREENKIVHPAFCLREGRALSA